MAVWTIVATWSVAVCAIVVGSRTEQPAVDGVLVHVVSVGSMVEHPAVVGEAKHWLSVGRSGAPTAAAVMVTALPVTEREDWPPITTLEFEKTPEIELAVITSKFWSVGA